MAGGKETPRQKLISLMYLVLLALLALQVSSAIIDKFQYLNESMETANKINAKQNLNLIAQIRQGVENGKNAEADQALLKEALEIRSRSKMTLDYIQKIKSHLITITGGKNAEGNYEGAKEEDAVATYMLGSGGNKKGEAYNLKSVLSGHTEYINKVSKELKTPILFESLSQDGKDDPIFKNNPEQRIKDFAQLNFEHTPLIAALAILSDKANKITSMESALLAEINNRIGGGRINVDKIRPVVKAPKGLIIEGMNYEADMFMAAYSSEFKPQMTFNKDSINVDPIGVGKINFRAKGRNFVNGVSQEKWTGSITYPKADGTDSTYLIEQNYKVIRPAIQVQANTVNSLYKNCGNKLTFMIPALGEDYNPKFEVVGGTLASATASGKVVVIPSQPNVTVKISNNGTYIGSSKFKVKLIPVPEIEVLCSNKKINPISGNSITDVGRLELKITPDKSFKELNPNDSDFRPKKWQVRLVRNKRVVGTKQLNRARENIRAFLSQKGARSGDILVIDEIKIKRKNYLNRVEDFKVGDKTFVIQIN